MKVAITNLGTIVSGDWRSPFVQGDTIVAHDGKVVSAVRPMLPRWNLAMSSSMPAA